MYAYCVANMWLFDIYAHSNGLLKKLRKRKTPDKIWGFESAMQIYHLFENFFNVLSAVFVAFLGRVAVYLLRTVESSGLLYAAGGNFM